MLIVLSLFLSFNVTAFAQQGTGPFTATPIQPDSQFIDEASKDGKPDVSSLKLQSFVSPGGERLVSIIVELADPPLAAYTGGAVGLAPTAPAVTGGEMLDLSSADSQRYLDYLAGKQEAFKAQASRAGPDIRIVHTYKATLNGLSMVLPESKLEVIASLPGVVAIYPDELQKPDTEVSPGFISATTAWKQLGGQKKAGEGIIVGVLDTGIWPEHPSFSDPDPFSKSYSPPPVVPGSNGFGSCGPRSTCDFGNTAANPNDAPFTCNNKLNGAYSFIDTYKAVVGLLPGEFDSARDDNGHGTHTSSTAAGNGGVTASIFGVPRGTVSGIAPRAHVIMYRVCAFEGCFQSDSVAAVEQAILDGVNAINFSISGGNAPYSDPVEPAFRSAYETGVFVSASAGNSGPTADTVNHRGPWTMTVAASTTYRHFLSTVSLTADNGDSLTLSGASVTDDISTPTPVVFPPTGQELCLDPFAPGTFNGEIVICQRGVIARVAKSFNVAGGGGGMLLYNPTLLGLATDNHLIPSVHLENDAGAALLDFMGTHSGVMGMFTAGTATTVQGDVMAAFSSRGGPAQILGVNKPDVTAPGVQILAGHSPMPATVEGGLPGELFQAIQGTSMSAPHVAGAAVLLKDMHPNWTPGQIKSALMTSAVVAGVTKEDGVTPADPFDFGAGRIDLSDAGKVGFTFDETAADYTALQNELWNANYPSLYVPVMPGQITVQRTAHSEVKGRRCWTTWVTAPPDVTVKIPKVICINGGADKAFSITVDARFVPLGEVRHAMIEFKFAKSTLHFPISFVRREPIVALDKTCDPASFPEHGTTDCTITIANNAFSPATVDLQDRLPNKLKLVDGSVVGATQVNKRLLTFNGTLLAAGAPQIDVAPGASPAGYLSLTLFGVPPLNCSGSCDDTGFNFSVASRGGVRYNETVYNTVGMASNGFVQLGGLTSATANNQNLPNPNAPNNVLAPFWSDLHPLGGDGLGGGRMFAAFLSDGVNTWLVLEWKDVFEFGGSVPRYSFQVWLRTGGAVQDLSYTYGRLDGTGAGNRATVGAENADGTIGDSYYFDGAGTFPALGMDLVVSSVPGTPGETHTITFTARGEDHGAWTNCALMTSDRFFGTNIACFSGEVTE